MKTRLLALVVAMLCFGLSASAQERKPDPENPGLHIEGDLNDVAVIDLIKWWCEYEKVQLIYQPKQVAAFKVSFMVPTSGVDIKPGNFGQLVADALDPFKLVILETSEGRYSIVPAAEAITQAPVMDVETARKAPGWKWITVRIPVRHGDANSYRGALITLVSRAGGSVQPIQLPQHLLVCDRADRARRIIDVVEAMEAEGTRYTSRTFELPPGIRADAVVEAFTAVVMERFINTKPASAAGLNAVVVRGTPEQLAKCEELLKALHAHSAKIAAALKLEVRRYETAKNPEAVADSLNKLFKEEVSASAVPEARAVLVKATPATHDEVKAALDLMK